jgi:3-phosphoshikimate 1-carboxyvinyltransferase
VIHERDSAQNPPQCLRFHTRLQKHRALITAGLAKGESLLQGFLTCEDTLYTVRALRELGAEVSIEGERAEISGMGGRFSPVSQRKEIFLGNSGTSYRLLLSVAALGRGEYLLTGTPRMHQRPIGALVTALNQVGVTAACTEKEGYPPVLIRASGIPGGKATLPGNRSSQFVSSLLLSGPYAEKDLVIEIQGRQVSRPYVELTLEVMEQFGVFVRRDGPRRFRVPSHQPYMPRRFTVEGDVSSASYFWAGAAVTGGTATTQNIYPHTTRQGDIRFLDILEKMGCRIEKGEDRVVVRGGSLTAIDADMGPMPDLVPTLAAVALFAKGKTLIRNVPHLRNKESDRLRSLALELSRIRGRVKELPDGLVVQGGSLLSGAVVDPHDDHRIAMSLAVVGLRTPGIRIRGEDCVDKSFPGFWEAWDGL